MHVSTLSLFSESTIFLILVVNAENGNIVLLSRASIRNCCWSFNCFTVKRGVCKQPQVKFLSRIVDGHISLPVRDIPLDALSELFFGLQFLNLVY
jgi:hypothetical protein